MKIVMTISLSYSCDDQRPDYHTHDNDDNIIIILMITINIKLMIPMTMTMTMTMTMIVINIKLMKPMTKVSREDWQTVAVAVAPSTVSIRFKLYII